MKKLLPLLAVVFGLVIIGNIVDNDSEVNNESNYTVIDSSDEDDYYNESDTEDYSIPAFIPTDEAESVDETIADSQDEASTAPAKDLPKTELEAKENLEKAKAEALSEYEKAIAEAEAEYEMALVNLGIEISKTSETETEVSTEKDISGEVIDTTMDNAEADAEAEVQDDKSEKSETANHKETAPKKQTDVSDNDTKPETKPAKEQVKEQPKADDSMKNTADEKPASAKNIEEVTEKVTEEVAEKVAEETTEVSDDQNTDGKVWIPESGKKYHKKKDCSNMKNPSKVTKEYAVSVGYTPCKRCYKNQ